MKEGDGNHIIQSWKFALLLFKANNHNKYALAAFNLMAQTMAILTPHQAHCLTWNRTVNNGHGNISLDLRLEHIKKLTKDMLKNLGPNITETTALRCSKSVHRVEQLLQSVDNELELRTPHGRHKVKKSEADFRSIVNELHQRGKVFKYSENPERQYLLFKNFQANYLLKDLNLSLVNKWMTQNKLKLQKD